MEKLFVEFIGTFIFLSVILSQSQAIPIALTLAAMIYFGGAISGGNFNPAVSFLQYLGGKFDGTQLTSYVIAQLLGATLAFHFNRNYRQQLI